jgi:hypothetical protein
MWVEKGWRGAAGFRNCSLLKDLETKYDMQPIHVEEHIRRP